MLCVLFLQRLLLYDKIWSCTFHGFIGLLTRWINSDVKVIHIINHLQLNVCVCFRTQTVWWWLQWSWVWLQRTYQPIWFSRCIVATSYKNANNFYSQQTKYPIQISWKGMMGGNVWPSDQRVQVQKFNSCWENSETLSEVSFGVNDRSITLQAEPFLTVHMLCFSV